MDLESYRNKNGITRKQFAQMIGVTQMTVGRYERGLLIPSPENMRKIYDVTGGQVSPADFYGVPSFVEASAQETRHEAQP